MSNTVIKRVFISLSERQQELSSCSNALREMIENNSALEMLIVNRSCGTHRTKNELSKSQDAFAQILFRGLQRNSHRRRTLGGEYAVVKHLPPETVDIGRGCQV